MKASISRPDCPTAGPVPQEIGKETRRERLRIDGAVQGVGFRPFVYRLAQQLGLSGHVRNTPAGAVVEVEGAAETLEIFRRALLDQKPPQARILALETDALAIDGGQGFMIRPSVADEAATTLILPDLAVCADCLKEMNDPADRRYRYPFVNCTNCGPRFSIVTALPYDRSNTTMAGFDMCKDCRSEYENPDDRRYHAQAIACPRCGPQLAFRTGNRETQAGDALSTSVEAVRQGKILALKGLGGFHLICDARNADAVAELRRRKARPVKPFAVMYPSLTCARADCVILQEEERLLKSTEAPIVLLQKKKGQLGIADCVAPDNSCVGVMLPYTPLHHLLVSELGFPVVATSGNRAGEPICFDEDDALKKLNGIADVFLLHNRPISGRCDDSVVRIMRGAETVLRRARGYAPMPVTLNDDVAGPVLAVGSHLKNTVALAVKNHAFVSPHIGDLDTPEARKVHRDVADFLCSIYGVKPGIIVRDLHPDYGSNRLADDRGANIVAVQHHHAHALACMADNGVETPCLAIVWDGAGYGTDNTIWGGEFLRIVPRGFERVLHFRPFPLPGGDAAALNPNRTALGMLYELEGDEAFGREIGLPGEDDPLLRSALKNQINCPMTSSAGRIFDAVSALTGICGDNSFEGQAAMALESVADPDVAAAYDFRLENNVIDWRPMLRAILEDIECATPPGTISAKFHATLADMIVAAAKSIDEKQVLLTGGCFQNALLTELAAQALERCGFTVHLHRQVPPNDGGLALGQIQAVAHAT